MADFKVKNGLQAKRYLQTTTALASTATAIDLSKGNNFSITPSGNPTFTFTNPPATGKAQAFSVEVTGGSNGMDEIFNTTLYTTDGTSSKTITTGMDLSSNEGLVWLKRRSGSYSHSLFDTVRGVQKQLQSDATTAESTETGGLTAFNSNGFTIGNVQNQSVLGNMVAWTWKSTANFFDVVTYSGNGVAGRTVSHNLGSVPGMIIVKRTNGDTQWPVFHTSLGQGHYLHLDANTSKSNYDSGSSNSRYWNNTAPTSTEFTVSSNSWVNSDEGTYVAYLFAHNSSTVSCGSYTGNGSATGPTVDVGFQPQWIMIKRASGGTGDWDIYDSTRGIPDGAGDLRLEANTSDAESTPGVDRINVSSSGFSIATTNSNLNTNGDTYIYTAIAASAAGSLTWPTSVKYPGGTAPSSPALGKKDVFTFMTVDGGTSYVGKKAVEGLS